MLILLRLGLCHGGRGIERECGELFPSLLAFVLLVVGLGVVEYIRRS